MPRRFIASLLVFAMLGLAGGWAFAGHGPALVDHDAHSFGAHGDQHGSGDAGDCDHCCHAGAHLVGLTSAVAVGLHPRKEAFHLPTLRSLAIRGVPPPLKPPRARSPI